MTNTVKLIRKSPYPILDLVNNQDKGLIYMKIFEIEDRDEAVKSLRGSRRIIIKEMNRLKSLRVENMTKVYYDLQQLEAFKTLIDEQLEDYKLERV